MGERQRCGWAESDSLLRTYHDREWGVPVYDSRRLWEMLTLEGFQAGLSWLTILRKREAFREAFCGFDPEAVALFGKRDVARLLRNEGIVRSRAKIEAVIGGAGIFVSMKRNGEDFARTMWAHVNGQPVRNTTGIVPAKTPLSEAVSADLKRRGFGFVGPVIVYAWMQAVGMVDDHAPGCFRYRRPSR